MLPKNLHIWMVLFLFVHLNAHAANDPFMVRQCAVEYTGNPLDFSILGDGYFVVSQGKKDSTLLFTRGGHTLLDEHHDLRVGSGDYLMVLNEKTSNKLGKIHISNADLTPKATTKIKIRVHLPNSLSTKATYSTVVSSYDALSNEYKLAFLFSSIGDHLWHVDVLSEEKQLLDSGSLLFDDAGILIKQQGLKQVQSPVHEGVQELAIDFKGSTQFGTAFDVLSLDGNGQTTARLSGISLSVNGDIILIYSNGKTKKLHKRIAIAQFTNPKYLAQIPFTFLYKPTEKSGSPMIHWVNSEGAMLGGCLEQLPCE